MTSLSITIDPICQCLTPISYKKGFRPNTRTLSSRCGVAETPRHFQEEPSRKVFSLSRRGDFFVEGFAEGFAERFSD